MPELPEVETVRRGLQPVMEGKRIGRAEVRRPDLRWPFPENMAERLTGQRILSLRRRSKYILADLSSNETLLVHLGMSGRMLIDDAPTANFNANSALPGKHDHVIFHMQDGATITFNDARRFGAMDLIPTDRLDAHWLLEKLGPEPLGNAFDEPYLKKKLSGRNSPIKTALLDQRVVSGLGNIYVCEVLHHTGISPKRKAAKISGPRVASMVPAIRAVLSEAIDAGGSSLRDHRQTNGELGYFQHRFAVYDREGEDCCKEGCDGRICRIVQSGRSSFYCPTCQR
ncbi:bifunctional DNA-formamidopyrimidine glycosylase/DNA-(apurinic or apyrimidinic site) lyase [uncultured Litoreibacter sp.]|uniref:bifunctional DNA-formamidopyrimidine glycosylase/DNA-(apurinic or apyrimidinic site) lyase n=1 Tax=uncultured Litoreibacter sp. TaxID=1392394 RepID=UPI002613872D|nr:bifunctional DNA-formamidopyrimidine glycosylase/DNA-(apurinic or apyrimidinic site) lyase [uncultured Litoreibacter sp.]